ncbi:MAG: sugar ABC transporter permease [Caldilineaceae bacterium SB0664_bin_22]|nr:sugar ABC transporter permease [Caldilineaceae bacterium SB0664_bin_22]
MTARPAPGNSRDPLLLQVWKGRTGYLMLVPTMVLLGVFMYYPAFLGLYRSLFDWAPGLDADFVGLGNMLQLSLWYVLSTVFVSLFVAILLHRMISQRLKYLYRFLAILPVIIPGIVLLMLWKFIYDATVGPLNMLLIAIGLEEWTRAWLANPNTALYAVMLRNFPWVDGVAILILLAGLQVIPQEIIESARIDGATNWRILRSVEFPLITGQIKLLTVLTIMWGVQEFTAVFAMTQGGPINKTMVPGMWMFWNAFRINKMGYAAAIGVILFVLTLILTLINMKYITTQEY